MAVGAARAGNGSSEATGQIAQGAGRHVGEPLHMAGSCSIPGTMCGSLSRTRSDPNTQPFKKLRVWGGCVALCRLEHEAQGWLKERTLQPF